jgi:hypothetical protein
MGFGRSWPELALDLQVHINCSADQRVTHAFYSFRERDLLIWSEHPLHYILINRIHRLDAVRLDIKNVIMSDVSVSNKSTTATRRTHSSAELYLCGLTEIFIYCWEIEPTTIVHPLPEKFDWWLGCVLFFLRHVKIIDKNNSSLAKGWSINTFSLFLHVSINNILG